MIVGKCGRNMACLGLDFFFFESLSAGLIREDLILDIGSFNMKTIT